MGTIHLDINLHDLTMLVLNQSKFANTAPEQLAIEVAQKYIEVRRIILNELNQHTNPGTTVLK